MHVGIVANLMQSNQDTQDASQKSEQLLKPFEKYFFA
jgi:hypothetical protein